MIIACVSCSIKYRLDDAKISPKGTKVRCSRCQYVFTVKPPTLRPREEIILPAESAGMLDNENPVLSRPSEAQIDAAGETNPIPVHETACEPDNRPADVPAYNRACGYYSEPTCQQTCEPPHEPALRLVRKEENMEEIPRMMDFDTFIKIQQTPPKTAPKREAITFPPIVERVRQKVENGDEEVTSPPPVEMIAKKVEKKFSELIEREDKFQVKTVKVDKNSFRIEWNLQNG
jgi:predicted Zn finger-like uncharacterized protein